MTEHADFLVIGAGIAGSSAAYELAALGSVIVVEREAAPAYHTTGRSAALYTETYGNRVIRSITSASRDFLEAPPPGLVDHPVLTPRGTLLIGRKDQEAALDAAFAEAKRTVEDVHRIDEDELLRKAPIFRRGYAVGAVWEPASRDIDVHELQQGYLRGMRARGGRLVVDAGVERLVRNGKTWTVETHAGRFEAPVVVNAAGAWADEIATLAGAQKVGLVPKRRTAFTFDVPAAIRLDAIPAVIDVDETWYVKPEAGRLLGSPADETPSPPCDAQPEELDLAVAVDRIEQALTFKVPRFHSKWAGLRSFVADKTPVAGFAPEAPGFFWLAGQGGYGIQSSPGMARIAAALATGKPLPNDIAAAGVTEADLAPDRKALRPS
ncbi:MAG: FAD-binding oxidoreductase [Proteobacteria bacterium]|nr:FAD-binding oxidoreductase [Pseudomonadota bacterium]MBI3497503.1 FAD-binding oxidoreductase [Pseudomonadota bacterium]